MLWPRWILLCFVGTCVFVNARPLGATEDQSSETVSDRGAREEVGESVPGRANEEPPRVESRAKRGSWYGYQTLAVDAAAAASIFVATKTDGGEVDAGWLFWPGVAAYFFGAPLVHLAHGGQATLGSFALRLAPPLVVAAGALVCYPSVGAASSAEYISPLPILGAVFGCGTMALGMALFPAVIIADAAALAYERVEPPTQSLVFPSYDPTRRAGILTWAGTF